MDSAFKLGTIQNWGTVPGKFLLYHCGAAKKSGQLNEHGNENIVQLYIRVYVLVLNLVIYYQYGNIPARKKTFRWKQMSDRMD